MKVTIVEGTPEEVRRYMEQEGLTAPLAPVVSRPPGFWRDQWEPDWDKVEPWANDVIGRTLAVYETGTSGENHRCEIVGWDRRGEGVRFRCVHNAGQYRQLPDKVLKRKEAS